MKSWAKPYRNVICLMALWPEGCYASALCEGLLEDERQEPVLPVLERCVEKGLLTKGRDGYSMHPFVSLCIRPIAIHEEETGAFLPNIKKLWEAKGLVRGTKWNYFRIMDSRL